LIFDVTEGRTFPLPITNQQFFPSAGKTAQSSLNWAGFCPFHDDKEPASLIVTPQEKHLPKQALGL